MGSGREPESFENVYLTASEHCGWMGNLVVDHVKAILFGGGELEATFVLIRKISVEAADCILFAVVKDDARRLALCEAIAANAVKDAHGQALKAWRA
jgi:hypothetical protein